MSVDMGKGTVYYMMSRFAFLLSSYAIHITMAYYLKDPRDYGTLGVIISLVTIARVFLSNGLPQATSRFIAQQEENASAILRSSLRIQLFLVAVVLVFYLAGIPLWTYLLNDRTLTRYILCSAPLVPLMATFQIYLSYFNGKRLFGKQAFFSALYSVGRFVFAFVLVLLGMKIFGVLLGFIISLTLALVLSKLSIKTQPESCEFNSRTLVNFAAPIILLSVGISFLLNLDVLLLKHFFPDSDAIGYYTGAMNLGKAPYFIFYAFSVTLLPSLSKALSENNLEKVRGLIERNLSYLLFLSIPSAAIVLATSEKLLDFVYPQPFTEASDALGILIFSMSLLALLFALVSVITASGKPRVSMTIILLCIPIQITSGLYLIPRYGMVGAACSHLLTVCFGTVIATFLVWKYFRTLFDLSRVTKTVVCSFVIYLLLKSFTLYPVGMLPVVYILAFGLFFVIMILIGGVSKNDIAFVKKLFHR